MDLEPVLTLRIDKPAAGGRMIARHEGRVVLVSGAIPGELVRAQVERVERSLAFATVLEVLEPHPSRRDVQGDPRCGGAVYAHMAPEEQRRVKADVIRDALGRLGRIAWDGPIPVAASPERGYRMRARLHVRDGRLGFFLEGTHEICGAAATAQLSDEACDALAGLADELAHARLRGGADIELSENRPATERALHVELEPESELDIRALRLSMRGVTGFSCSMRGHSREHLVGGEPLVTDVLECPGSSGEPVHVSLRRHVRAFFQGNRFLLDPLVSTVCAACPDGEVVDLYAGVGLFGVCLAAGGRHTVRAVEGHRASARDLRANASPFGGAIEVIEAPVERVVASATAAAQTVVIDPPRTGMTKEAVAGVIRWSPTRIVFVSCDVATFARDLRRLIDAGYVLEGLQAFDLFPNTAHVEVVGMLARG